MHKKTANWRILVVAVKWRHRAIVLLLKTFLLALKGLELKDLFTELRFENFRFGWFCQEYDITKTSSVMSWLGGSGRSGNHLGHLTLFQIPTCNLQITPWRYRHLKMTKPCKLNINFCKEAYWMWFKNWWLFLFINYAKNAIDAKNYSTSFLAFFIFNWLWKSPHLN